MSFTAPIPILRIFDEAKARSFYVNFLGFRIDWEHRFAEGLPLYMEAIKGDCRLHLSEHHGDCCPGGAVRIQTDELDAYHQQLLDTNYANMRPGITTQPWGREMCVLDPFGNRLIFCEAQP